MSASEATDPRSSRMHWLAPRSSLLALLAILVLGVGLRCIHLTDPYIADFHAWRQADTAAFTQGYLTETFNPFSPRVSRQPCDIADSRFGLVEAELPIAAWMAAAPLKLFGVTFPPPWYLRLVSVAFYVISALYMWRLALLLGARHAEASLAVLVYSTLPIAVFFTRTPQPDGPALCFTLAFLFYLERWLKQYASQPADATPSVSTEPPTGAQGSARARNANLALAALSGSCMLLIKVSNAFVGIPALYLVVSALGVRRALKARGLWLAGGTMLGASAAWYAYAHSFPWTFGIWGDRAASKFATWALISSSSVWSTLTQRMAFPIAGWAALLVAAIGVGAGAGERRVRLCVVWLLAFAAFVVVVLQGHDTHIYYQLPCVLPLSLLAGRGAAMLCAAVEVHGVQPEANPAPARWPGRMGLLILAALHATNLHHVMFSPQTRGERRGFYHPDIQGIEGAALLREHLPARERFVSVDRNPVLFYNSRHQGYFAEGTSVKQLLRCAQGRARHILVPISYIRSEQTYQAQLRRAAESRHFLLWEVRGPQP